jgi:hypothetical protein
MSDRAGRFSFGSVPAGSCVLRFEWGSPRSSGRCALASERRGSLDLQMIPAAVPVDAVIVTPGYFGDAAGDRQRTDLNDSKSKPRCSSGRCIAPLVDFLRRERRLRSSTFAQRRMSFRDLDGLPLIEPIIWRFNNALSIVDLASLGVERSRRTVGEFGNQLA